MKLKCIGKQEGSGYRIPFFYMIYRVSGMSRRFGGGRPGRRGINKKKPR
jgi:hypothetical protein